MIKKEKKKFIHRATNVAHSVVVILSAFIAISALYFQGIENSATKDLQAQIFFAIPLVLALYFIVYTFSKIYHSATSTSESQSKFIAKTFLAYVVEIPVLAIMLVIFLDLAMPLRVFNAVEFSISGHDKLSINVLSSERILIYSFLFCIVIYAFGAVSLAIIGRSAKKKEL